MTATEQLRSALAGRYVLEREIGAGGMATVYLAEDPRHGRRVAIKVLHPELSAVLGPERFLAEIKTTAALQHPHILPLFDSGSADGLLYYVMPYVQGETLRARLEREQQLAVNDAVRIASEVADALQYAHAHGVVHRDIKPENILLQDGHALVADFGIALAVEQAGGARMTQTGLSLGTPQYMSPEQAMGERNVDARTDIYSLGAVTYEMLIGEPPFTGPTGQAIVAKVITETAPSVRAARPSVPAHVDAAVSRALEKLPADRFTTAREFADVLDGKVAIAPPRGALRPRTGVRARLLAPIIAGGVALLALGATAGWLTRARAASDDSRPTWFTVTPPPGVTVCPCEGAVAVSPDGRSVAYVGMTFGGQHIYLRRLDGLESKMISDVSGSHPFFSPDGRWIGFVGADNTLRKVAVGGGPAVVVAQGIGPGVTAWGANMIVHGDQALRNRGFMGIPVDGGAPRLVSHVRASARDAHEEPVVLPDGNTFVFSDWGPDPDDADDTLAVLSLATGTYGLTDLQGEYPYGMVGPYLVFAPGGESATLIAVPFDVRKRRATGSAVPVLDGVASKGAAASMSPSGTLAFVRGEVLARMAWATPHGAVQPLAGSPGHMTHLRLSPDGRRIALMIVDAAGKAHIWIDDVATGSLTRLSPDETGFEGDPEWSVDGQHVIFRVVRGGGSSQRRALAMRRADGSDTTELLPIPLPRGAANFGSSISVTPDGKTLLFSTIEPDGTGNIWSASLQGDHTPHPFATTQFDEYGARLSPDGKWVAYGSNESGSAEVYVRPFTGAGRRAKISTDGGREPMWSPDGRRLYYRSGARYIAAAVVPGATGLEAVRQDTVLDTPTAPDAYSAGYDVGRDGRLLVAALDYGSHAPELIVVTNWARQMLASMGHR